ncbi:MAG: O-antigen ligase family protein [Patescibacteria group bacterium]|nr:O-antigen ligase family protein [Patescibacteria group bacterium]
MEKVNRKLNKNLFYFLLALALLRPSLDIFSRIELQIHSSLPSFNLNVFIGGLVFLILSIFCLWNIKKIYSTPIFWSISIFLGLSFASIFYSIDSSNSLREFIRLASIFLLYFLAYQLIENRKDFYLLLKIILFSYILPGIVALIQLIGGWGLPDDFGGFQRIYGTFAHPNPFAFYTFFILALTLSLLLINKEKNKSWVIQNPYFLPVVAITFLLIATYTRSAIVCFFIFIFFFGIFKYRKLLIFGLLFFLGLYFFSDIFRERLWELISLDPYGSIVWRFRLWRDMLPISLWQPWFGYGLDTFTNIVEYYRGFELGSLDPHNDYLKIFVENGILGLLSYLAIIIGLLINLIKIFRKNINQEKIFALSFLIIVLSLSAASSFDNILRETALQWNLWILLGAWLKINSAIG